MLSNIRKASLDDINSIYDIIKFYADKNLILERSKEELKQYIDHFFVSELNNKIVGVISYYDYGQHLKEIRSFGILEEYSRKGIGSELLKMMIDYLLKDHPCKIFVLSYSPIFFKKNSFIEVPTESLPEKIWKDCSTCKNRDNCGEVALVYSK